LANKNQLATRKKRKVTENRDKGVGLNGSVKKRIVPVFIVATLATMLAWIAYTNPNMV